MMAVTAATSAEFHALAGFDTALEQYQGSLFEAYRHLYRPAMELAQWAPYINWGERLAGEGVLRSKNIIAAFNRINVMKRMVRAHRIKLCFVS